MGRRQKQCTLAAAICVFLLAGCKNEPKRTPSIGFAFTGPIQLDLREEVSPASKPIAKTTHGEKLEILQVRRRFVRVRTPGGNEGWTMSRNLLSSRQMEKLQELSKRSAKLPSQGEATVFSTLNMHAEPYRTSTSFYQITEGTRVDVLDQKASAKTQTGNDSDSLDLNKPTVPVRPRKKKKEPDFPPPPAPAPPGLPPNWIELSKTVKPEPPPEPAPKEEPADKKKKKRRVRVRPTGPPMEDWSLIRTKDGKAGWVLTRMLVMAIPDEVAQYAEGARITSYFPLATVDDDGVKKRHWLWTTKREDGTPYQFDSFRVFTWVLRRHRYETSYIERNIEGYYPVEATAGSTPKFSLILRGEDGKLYKKTWMMEGYMTRKVGEEIYTPKDSQAPGDKKDESISDKIRSLLDKE